MSGYRFTVPGLPVAKARHRARVVAAGGRSFASMYQPESGKTARFEERVRLCAMNAGVKPIAGPVALVVECYWPMRGTPRKNFPRPSEWKTTRPDADNVLKSVCDGLNGVAFADDSQACDVRVFKFHAAQGEVACVRIEVTPLGDS